jgi:GT2 family glycosyltransferase
LQSTLEKLSDKDGTENQWPWADELNRIDYSSEIEWPKISIITPSFNQHQFIEKTIRSVLLQNYPNLEFIIMDGESTDGSVEVIKKYASKLTYWVSQADAGQSDAINRGFEKATGEIFAWLNTDDYYLPGALKTVALTYLNNTDAAVQAWVGTADKVNEKGKLIYHSSLTDLSLESFYHWRNPQKPEGKGNFLQPACFFTSKAWKEAGPLDLELEYCMDVALWLRMAKEFKFAPISKKLAIAVGHSQAKTTKDREKTTAEVALVLAEYGGRNIAQHDLMRLIEEHIALKEKWRKLATSIPGRIYRKAKRLFN